MLDNSTNIDTDKATEVSTPAMIAAVQNGGKMDTTKYKVRVDRFELDAEMNDAMRLEMLYTRGIDGSGDVVILKEKSFTDKERLIVVVFYLERKLSNDPTSVLKSLRDAEE